MPGLSRVQGEKTAPPCGFVTSPVGSERAQGSRGGKRLGVAPVLPGMSYNQIARAFGGYLLSGESVTREHHTGIPRRLECICRKPTCFLRALPDAARELVAWGFS